MTQQPHDSQSDEFVTLIGADMDEIYAAFQAQGLAERQYSIVYRVARHRFTSVSGGTQQTMFDGHPMVAATFRRAAGA